METWGDIVRMAQERRGVGRYKDTLLILPVYIQVNTSLHLVKYEAPILGPPDAKT